MNTKYSKYLMYLTVAAVLVPGCFLGLRYINEFPAYIHAWAQADWYSIAVGFVNNGFDFFHPETLIYNKQFPDTWTVDNLSTVTSVDFPLHEYLVALLMTLFGTTAPWVFHLWTWLCSMAGLWFLFLLAHRLTSSNLKAAAAVLLCSTTPVYAFYMANFLPSAPSLAIVLAGLWAYVRYWQEGNRRYWHLAVSLLALGALTRTSQLVTLMAVCAYELTRILAKEEKMGKKWISPVLALLAIVGYYLWNQHLAAQYGTLFLGYLRPPKSHADVNFVFDHIQYSWQWQYFSRLQHWLVAIVLVAALVFILWRRRKKEQRGRLPLGWLAAIWFFGEVCFFVAMMLQYVDHDYYFLDSFHLPIILIFVLALRNLPTIRNRWVAVACIVALVVLGGLMYNGAKHTSRDRRSGDDRAWQTAQNYAGSAQWLDSLGVSRDAKLLTFLSYPQNSPFLLMERKGYTVMFHEQYVVDSALAFDFDYIVMENDMYYRGLEEHPESVGRFLPLATNGKLTLFSLATKE